MKSSSKRPPDTSGEKLSGWKIIYDGFDPSTEKLRESLCTLGNGYMGIRGAATESSASEVHYPGTYIAGLYNTLGTKVAGRNILNEDLVNCPNCLLLSFRANKKKWNESEEIQYLSYRQELDLKKGILIKTRRIQDEAGLISDISEKRIVHMEHPHLVVLLYEITPVNYSGTLLVRSGIDGSVENLGVERYKALRSKHLKTLSSGITPGGIMHLTARTNSSGIDISTAARLRIIKNEKYKKPDIITVKQKEKIGCEFSIRARKGLTVTLEKTCAVFTSRDNISGSVQENALSNAGKAPSFKKLENSQASVWKNLWEKCDVRVSGDISAQTILRFHIFHLLQSASPNNTLIDAGIAARGLHGESYRGHVFWDELFVLPFISTHLDKTGEALLLYRYRRLNEARKYARSAGYRGAMFPWQSGSSGKEETQSVHLNPMSGKWGPDLSRNQRHVSFAIAYNTWRHWTITGDRSFLDRYGAELLLSIAKFGASLCEFDEKDGRYHTDGLMGPDEFHEKMPFSSKGGLKDNAYSNLLIVWTLLRAIDTLDLLSKSRHRELKKKIGITNSDIEKWKDISRKMNIIISNDGIISQFDGYFDLEELDWKYYREKYGDIHRMDRVLKAEGRSPDDYKVAKQADVLMLFYLFPFTEVKTLFERLGYRLTKRMLRKNYHYYETRTSHGSTLSKVVHCHVSHLLGMTRVSSRWYDEVLAADIHDIQGGTTPEGIHAGIMGGSLDIAVRAFAGLHIGEQAIKINPSLPSCWKSLAFRLKTNGNWIQARVARDKISIGVEKQKKAEQVRFDIKGKQMFIWPGQKITVNLQETS